MLNIEKLRSATLRSDPFAWVELSDLLTPSDAAELASSYPQDAFKTVEGYGGEKDYCYEVRALIGMSPNPIRAPGTLSRSWSALVHDLLDSEYRSAMASLTGIDLSSSSIEVNVHHYGPGARLGPHRDLPEKLVAHIFYFNQRWDHADGGCLSILNSGQATDVAAEVMPIVGTSAILVRSETSWHQVTRVRENCLQSRRCMTVTFYRCGAVSTMWPPGDAPQLHRFNSDQMKAFL